MSSFHPIDVILHKREGLALSEEEIRGFVRAIVDRTAEKPLVTDAQISAFLMAVYFRGLETHELQVLTDAMRFSGDTFDAGPLKTFTIDKHSTGGVGDKTSLLIAPILAAAGVSQRSREGVPGICVPMISGRSLGHTGGTLDKLETIPGFNTQLDLQQLAATLRQCGAAMIGQTPRIVPADRTLYALRDHTGTVESPYLITASIMSKKLAESLNALVLDVKVGCGAFMPSYEQSRFLAKLMVETGEASGTRTAALLTTMDEPLGRFSGNWVEVWECVDIMKQVRHSMSADLIELTNALAGWMLHLAGRTSTPEDGAAMSDQILRSGDAFKAWLSIVQEQGGDTSLFKDPASHHKPALIRTFRAPQSGYLAAMDCKQIGWAVQRLGAGRVRPGEPVSAHAGIECFAKLGDRLERGQPVFTLFGDSEGQVVDAEKIIRQNITIADEPPVKVQMVRDVITKQSTV